MWEVMLSLKIRRESSQRGNILFLILLAIILFAALAYAVNNGLRGGGKDASSESAKAIAAQVIQYTTLMEQTVSRLRLSNGCKDTEISFLYDSDGDGVVETNGQDDYYNPNAPTDKRCHVFDPAGGGMSYAKSPSYIGTGYSFGGQYVIKDVGTPDFDLVMSFTIGGNDANPNTVAQSRKVCDEMNQSLIGTTTKLDDDYASGQGVQFAGVYGVKLIELGDEPGAVKLPPGHRSACYRRIYAGGGYFFYHVLIAR